MTEHDYKYSISFGFKDNIVAILAALFFDGLAIFMYLKNNGAFIAVGASGCFVTVVLLVSVYRTLFNKIYIYDNYFVHVMSPFKKITVNDCEVEDAWIHQMHTSNGVSGYYFNYRTRDGIKGKIIVSPAKYDFADYLVERLKGNDVSDYEKHINDEYGY